MLVTLRVKAFKQVISFLQLAYSRSLSATFIFPQPVVENYFAHRHRSTVRERKKERAENCFEATKICLTSLHCANFWAATTWAPRFFRLDPRSLTSFSRICGSILMYTAIGASEQSNSWDGWLMASQSITTMLRPFVNSYIRSTSFCTSAVEILKRSLLWAIILTNVW